MIEYIFTLDYEIFGNGTGSLRESVYKPAERIKKLFGRWDVRFVVFPEVAELEMIEAAGSDSALARVKEQLRSFYRDGFEIGLHFHPWWYNSKWENGKWSIDKGEYNLCHLTIIRIQEIIDRAIFYLRYLIDVYDYVPMTYRAGHLLFQPTQPTAKILAEKGIQIDSSVYKGGLWRHHKSDYRRAPRRKYFWKFSSEVTLPDPRGILLELPIYARMVPSWRMFTAKRTGFRSLGHAARPTGGRIISRAFDMMRLRYPLKYDLGQMTRSEMCKMADIIERDEENNPAIYRPIVVLMHTKDPIDYEAVEGLLIHLDKKGIKSTDFGKALCRIKAHTGEDDQKVTA